MDSLGAANSSLSTPSALPNPYTPLAWLSPKVADSVQGLQYVEVATAGVSALEFSRKRGSHEAWT